jgi:ketosteroid isomerase-like protein
VVVEDPEAHYERAKAAGAEVLHEPHEAFGGRQRGYIDLMREPGQTVQLLYEAFDREAWDELLALFDGNAEIDLSRSGIPDLGIYHGHEGLREGWRRWRGAWERFDVVIEDVIEGDERVVALTRIQARSRGHGLDTEFTGADVFTVRGGSIVRFANYLDREAARQDAGL